MEVMIALVVLAIGTMSLVTTMSACDTLSTVNQEQSLAYAHIRAKIEELRDHTFRTLYADYKPGGPSGNTWTIAGMDPIPNVPQGQIFFPEAVVVPGDPPTLSETIVDTEMGMPTGGRDLNGDGLIAAGDRSLDYTLLPVKLTVQWMGVKGESSLTVSTWIVQK